MSVTKINSSWLLVMFLISPWAWGDSEGLGVFVSRVNKECTQTFAARLTAASSALSPTNSRRLASALCEDDRIFWPFAQAMAPELAPRFEDEFRSQRTYAPPMMIGLIGASSADTTDVLQALRKVIYPGSRGAFKWTGDRIQARNWTERFDGGLLGGVIHVDVNGDSDERLGDAVRVASDAMSYTVAHHMDSYLLAVSSKRDVRALFPEGGDPIRWVLLEPSDCDGRMRSSTH